MQSFLKYFGPFSPRPPLPRSLDTFLFGKVHCDILYHSLHLLIALAAPGVHFQDALREGGLLAATPHPPPPGGCGTGSSRGPRPARGPPAA